MNLSLHFLILSFSSQFPHSLSISSPFPLHFLILSSFPRSPAARLQRFVQPWPPVCEIRAVHIKEELALQGQRVPTHVTSANAGRRSVGVGSEDIFFNC